MRCLRIHLRVTSDVRFNCPDKLVAIFAYTDMNVQFWSGRECVKLRRMVTPVLDLSAARGRIVALA